MSPDQDVLARLERLERSNRRLRWIAGLGFAFPLLAIAGWQSAVPDVLRVHRLEVVDSRGVPYVTLAPERTGSGGSIVLRDQMGEKRSWWEVGPGTAALGMVSEDNADAHNSTLGFSVAPRRAEVDLIAGDGASLSASLKDEKPRLDIWSRDGKSLFGAPFKSR